MKKLFFLLLLLMLPLSSAIENRYESVIGSESSSGGTSGQYWQTFTVGFSSANTNFTVTNISLFASSSNIGNVTFSLRTVNGSGYPTNNVIASGLWNTAQATNAMVPTNISFTTNRTVLKMSTKYAIWFEGTTGLTVSQNDTYAGGNSFYGGGIQPVSTRFMVWGNNDTLFVDTGTAGNLSSSFPTVNFTMYGFNRLNFINATVFVWNSSGAVVNTSTSTISGNNTNTSTVIVSGFPPISYYIFNVRGCAGNALGNNCTLGSNRTFFYGIDITNETYNPTTVETATERFLLNFTIATSSIILSNASFYYNGTSYPASTISQSGMNYTIVRNHVIPSVTASGQFPFFWSLLFDNGAQVNTSSNLQTVTNIGIDNCTSNSVVVINYTMYDEDTRTLLNATSQNTTVDYTVKISADPTGQVYASFSNRSRINPTTICVQTGILGTIPLRIDSDAQYSSLNRVTEYNVFENVTLNATTVPIHIGLYDLLITSSTEFSVRFRNRQFIPQAGIIIELARQYLDLGSSLVVESSRTDSAGRTVEHFVINNQVYTIFVKRNNQVIAAFTDIQAFCSDIVTGNCQINLDQSGASTQPDDFSTIYNVSVAQTYNDTTRVFTYIFSANDGISRNFLLNVTQFNNTAQNSVCSSSIFATTGTLSCTIPTALERVTVIASLYANGQTLVQTPVNVDSILDDNLPPERYIYAALLVLTLPLMAAASTPVMFLLLIIGLILVGLTLLNLGPLIGGLGSIGWIVITVIIILYKFNKKEEQ